MWHQCYILVRRVTFLRSPYMTPIMWHTFIPPMTYAAEEDSIPLCYFNYNNNAFHLYFLYCDILYHSNKYISLIFASSLVLILMTFVPLIFASLHLFGPIPADGQISSTVGKLDAKMQILLHLKRFTKSRVCIRDTDSPSRDQPRKSRRQAQEPDQAVISSAKIANVHVRPIFIRSRFRLVSKSCRRSCVSRALTGNSAP